MQFFSIITALAITVTGVMAAPGGHSPPAPPAHPPPPPPPPPANSGNNHQVVSLTWSKYYPLYSPLLTLNRTTAHLETPSAAPQPIHPTGAREPPVPFRPLPALAPQSAATTLLSVNLL